jgi:hypothetical protein
MHLWSFDRFVSPMTIIFLSFFSMPWSVEGGQLYMHGDVDAVNVVIYNIFNCIHKM